MSFTNQYHRIQNVSLKMVDGVSQAYGSMFGHQNYAHFAIVSYARTGSNYLSDGIKSSKSVHMYHEIFAEHNRILGKDFDKIMSRLYGKQEYRIKNVGFKLFYYHLTVDEWNKFLSHEDFDIIHLTRRNRLRTLVSLAIAAKTDRWTSGNNHLQLQSKIVNLNPDNLIKRIEEIEDYENTTRNRFKNRRMLEVVYEDMTRDPTNEFMGIGNFVGTSDIDLRKIHIQKQNPENLRDLIANFDEIFQLLNTTRFYEYLYS